MFAIAITIYFWWQNTLGIEESIGKAIAIMQVTTVMAVTMIIWCGLTLMVSGGHLPPFVPSFNNESLGWLNHLPSRARIRRARHRDRVRPFDPGDVG